MTGPALETRALRRLFGGLVATDTVDFKLEAGARHALIGPNGAGKTTFVNLLSGALPPTSGSIHLAGQDVTDWPASCRARAGLSRTFQINQLFAGLTPLQSVVLTLAQAKSTEGGLARVSAFFTSAGSDTARVEEAAALLEGLHLGDCLDRDISTLAYGQQRLLEIAIALAAKPQVLLLDEPAAGISQEERELVLNVIGALPAEIAIVLIEHDMDLVFRFARSITVLVNGSVLTSGTVAEISADERVRKVYLGEGEHA